MENIYLCKEKIRLIIRALLDKKGITERRSIFEKPRTTKKHSMEELADKCGVSVRTIKHIYEGGDACDVIFRELSAPLSRLICQTRFVDEEKKKVDEEKKKKEEGQKHAGSQTRHWRF